MCVKTETTNNRSGRSRPGGGGGYSGFQVTGMIEWEQKPRSQKIPRASNKTQKKSLDQKLTPQKIPSRISDP